MKRLQIVGITFWMICFGLFFNGMLAQAVTPRVMLTDYSIKEQKVVSGQDFTLTIGLHNTAAKDVKNVKVSVLTENGEFLPVNGAGTSYLEKIVAGEQADLDFNLTAVSGLEEKSYKLSIKTEYAGSDGMEYEANDTIFLPVQLTQRVSVTDVFLDEDSVQVGDMVEVSANINNLGEGALYNVVARIEGDNVQEMETYIGNIESGKSGTLDALTKATTVSEGQHTNNKIIISYEDKSGVVKEEECKFQLGVTEPVYSNLEKVKEQADYSNSIRSIVIFVVCVAVLALAIYLIVKRQKKKQQMLDDFLK